MGATYQGIHSSPKATFDDFDQMCKLANMEAKNFTQV